MDQPMGFSMTLAHLAMCSSCARAGVPCDRHRRLADACAVGRAWADREAGADRELLARPWQGTTEEAAALFEAEADVWELAAAANDAARDRWEEIGAPARDAAARTDGLPATGPDPR